MALSIAALGLITTVNRVGAGVLGLIAGVRFQWLADTCFPSLLVCVFVYFGIRPKRPLALVQSIIPRGPLVRLGVTWLGIWLTASAVAALAVGHWIRYTTGLFPLICFVVIGPLQEELLYRGALFELVERGWPDAARWGPILGTTLPFALQHLQFHGYHLSSDAILQVGFTVPMGIVFSRSASSPEAYGPGSWCTC